MAATGFSPVALLLKTNKSNTLKVASTVLQFFLPVQTGKYIATYMVPC